jgi:hypothetical protein
MSLYDDRPEPCRTCGTDIEPDDEHYPHPPDCDRNEAGWCTCHHPTHPDCCPECNEGVPW